MPKGRDFAPGGDKEGVWFRHHVGDGAVSLAPIKRRREATTMEGMLSAPYHTDSNWYPWSPPDRFQHKDAGNYKQSNKFSDHDNRQHFQDKGEYFGDGRGTRSLGKRIIPPIDRQHFSQTQSLHHDGKVYHEYDYNTSYVRAHSGKPTAEPPIHRRFCRSLSTAGKGLREPGTATTKWHPGEDQPPAIPIKVLANSQVPYPQNTGRWRYSNHGMNRLYPPFITAAKPQRAVTIIN